MGLQFLSSIQSNGFGGDMTIIEKRKHSRSDSLNLINYIHFDENGEEGTQGMGRTLNVSQSGILLETHNPVDIDHIVSMTIGLYDDVVDIRGRVLYSKKNDAGKFESGIEFFDMNQEALNALIQYIAAFNSSTLNEPQEK